MAKLRVAAMMAKQNHVPEARRYLADLPAVTIDQRVQVRQAEAALLRDANDNAAAYAVLKQALIELPDSTGPALRHRDGRGKTGQGRRGRSEPAPSRGIEAGRRAGAQRAGLHAGRPHAADQRGLRADREGATSSRPTIPSSSTAWAGRSIGWASSTTPKRTCSRAMTQRPDAEIAAHLGEVLWKKGDTVRAKEVWQSQLQTTPRQPGAARDRAPVRTVEWLAGQSRAVVSRAHRRFRRDRARRLRVRACCFWRDARPRRSGRAAAGPRQTRPVQRSPADCPRAAATTGSPPISPGPTTAAATTSTFRRRWDRSMRGSTAMPWTYRRRPARRRDGDYPDWSRMTNGAVRARRSRWTARLVDPRRGTPGRARHRSSATRRAARSCCGSRRGRSCTRIRTTRRRLAPPALDVAYPDANPSRCASSWTAGSRNTGAISDPRHALADRSRTGEGQPLPARHGTARGRLPHAGIAVRADRPRRHDHARAAGRRRASAAHATLPACRRRQDLAVRAARALQDATGCALRRRPRRRQAHSAGRRTWRRQLGRGQRAARIESSVATRVAARRIAAARRARSAPMFRSSSAVKMRSRAASAKCWRPCRCRARWIALAFPPVVVPTAGDLRGAGIDTRDPVGENRRLFRGLWPE